MDDAALYNELPGNTGLEINSGYLRLDRETTKFATELKGENLLPWSRILIDARNILIENDNNWRLECGNNTEIALDLNVAETASVKYAKRLAGKLPWSNIDRAWTPNDFGLARNNDVYERMAEFIAARPVDVVLSPSHLLDQSEYPWLTIDVEGCHALRAALDRLGAVDIEIDYLLLADIDCFLDAGWRAMVIDAIRNAPWSRLWVRMGSFGQRSNGRKAGKLVGALGEFRQLGRPIVADLCGGLCGLSLLASGVLNGIAHGLCKSEKVDYSDWMKEPPPPKEKKSGSGPAKRAYLSRLDGYMTQKELVIFANHERRCTEFGINKPEHYFNYRKEKFLEARYLQFDAIFRHPPEHRLREFLGDLRGTLWDLKQIIEEDTADNVDVKAIVRAHEHMVELEAGLAGVHASGADLALPFRGRKPGQRPLNRCRT